MSGLAQAQIPDQRERSIHRLYNVASRLDHLNSTLQAFIDRYHGNPTTQTNGAGVPTGVPAGHIGYIAKIEDEVQRFDTLMAQVEDIG